MLCISYRVATLHNNQNPMDAKIRVIVVTAKHESFVDATTHEIVDFTEVHVEEGDEIFRLSKRGHVPLPVKGEDLHIVIHFRPGKKNGRPEVATIDF